MADLNYPQLVSAFNIRNRNSDNFEFTPAEVDSALKDTINYDPYVYTIGEDTSVTVTPGTFLYTPSENFEQIFEVTYDYYGNGSQVEFPYSWAFNLNNGTLMLGTDFMSAGGLGSTASWPLFLYGKIKLQDSDTIPNYLIDYIIHRAMCKTLDMLMADKTARFLRNDTTMAEIQAARSLHAAEAIRLQGMLPNRINVRL